MIEQLTKKEEQMNRVIMLNEMVSEILDDSLNYINHWREWNKVYDEKGHYIAGNPPIEPTDTEIKRLMLVLRQETIKLDKMI